MLLIDRHPEHADLIRFGDRCYWAWDTWTLAKLYCNAEDIHLYYYSDVMFVTILREYSLLQIAKIHDPKSSGKHSNHSIDYLATRYDVQGALLVFTTEHKEFIESVLTARRKVIAHNDLETVRASCRVGGFKDGLDIAYFRSLHQVTSLIYEKAGIGPFPEWPGFARQEADEFLEIVRGVQRSRQRGRSGVHHRLEEPWRRP